MIVSTTQARKKLKDNSLKTLGHGKPSYYVISESKPHRNLGGPYDKTGAEARLRQVEAFKANTESKRKSARKKALKDRTKRATRRRSKVSR